MTSTHLDRLRRQLAAQGPHRNPESIVFWANLAKGGIHLLGPATKCRIPGMAEESGPHPIGGVDYPRTLQEFNDWFSSEAAWSSVSATGSVAGELPMSAMCWQRGLADQYGPPEV